MIFKYIVFLRPKNETKTESSGKDENDLPEPRAAATVNRPLNPAGRDRHGWSRRRRARRRRTPTTPVATATPPSTPEAISQISSASISSGVSLIGSTTITTFSTRTSNTRFKSLLRLSL